MGVQPTIHSLPSNSILQPPEFSQPPTRIRETTLYYSTTPVGYPEQTMASNLISQTSPKSTTRPLPILHLPTLTPRQQMAHSTIHQISPNALLQPPKFPQPSTRILDTTLPRPQTALGLAKQT